MKIIDETKLTIQYLVNRFYYPGYIIGLLAGMSFIILRTVKLLLCNKV